MYKYNIIRHYKKRDKVEIERQEREAQPRTTRKLARALGVEPMELMKGEE